MTMKIILDSEQINNILRNLADDIIDQTPSGQDIAVIGIRSRGEVLAQRLSVMLSKKLRKDVPCGTLDITLYRDDLTQKGEYIEVRKSNMPFTVTGKTVVLVDDVIFAGRTARAALDGLKDYGRAAKVQLAVLIDRGHRELPIHPDFVGKTIPTAVKEDVKVEICEVDGVDRVVIK